MLTEFLTDGRVLTIALIAVVVVVLALRSSSKSDDSERDSGERATGNLRRKQLALPEQFVVVDLETTGLHSDRHEIIEIGAILVNRDSDHHTTFRSFVMPQGRITKKITDITGITRKMIAAEGGDPIEAVLPQFMEFIGDHPLVIFNAKFDMGFLHAAAAKAGLPPITNKVSCALELSRKAWPGRRSYRLTELAKAGNLETDGAHRALGDCQMTMIIYAAAAQELGRTA